MYGLPDSFIVGTARRVARSVTKPIKHREWDEMETSWGRLVAQFLVWLDKRAKRKSARKKLARKHRITFS
jgi:hypothetical protein